MERRTLICGLATSFAARATLANGATNWDRHLVTVNRSIPAGEIHVNTNARYLYFSLGGTRALRYGVAVGAAGRAFRGQARISRKALWPSWKPTANMIRLEPDLYGPFRDGLPGRHPNNPMGAAALYLSQNGRETYYRIHGTNQPWTIGRSFSSGCIRLRNQDIVDLFARAVIGTRVFVS